MKTKGLEGCAKQVVLMVGLEVDADMPYRERAKKILERTTSIKCGRKHNPNNRYIISTEGIHSLIGADAQLIRLNAEDYGGNIVTEVKYHGKIFLAVTDGKYNFVINGSLL